MNECAPLFLRSPSSDVRYSPNAFTTCTNLNCPLATPRGSERSQNNGNSGSAALPYLIQCLLFLCLWEQLPMYERSVLLPPSSKMGTAGSGRFTSELKARVSVRSFPQWAIGRSRSRLQNRPTLALVCKPTIVARLMRHLGILVSRVPIRRCCLPSNLSTPALHRLARYFTPTPLASRAGKPPKDRFNYNPEIFFDEAPDPEHTTYTRVTSNDLEQHTKPPTRVKMLVRDFIEDSLYNPHYGYFPQQATIFTSAGDPIDFRAMHDSVEFQNEVAKRYTTYGTDEEGPGRQIWHTPTELFKVRPTSDKPPIYVIDSRARVALLRTSHSTMPCIGVSP